MKNKQLTIKEMMELDPDFKKYMEECAKLQVNIALLSPPLNDIILKIIEKHEKKELNK